MLLSNLDKDFRLFYWLIVPFLSIVIIILSFYTSVLRFETEPSDAEMSIHYNITFVLPWVSIRYLYFFIMRRYQLLKIYESLQPHIDEELKWSLKFWRPHIDFKKGKLIYSPRTWWMKQGEIRLNYNISNRFLWLRYNDNRFSIRNPDTSDHIKESVEYEFKKLLTMLNSRGIKLIGITRDKKRIKFDIGIGKFTNKDLAWSMRYLSDFRKVLVKRNLTAKQIWQDDEYFNI